MPLALPRQAVDKYSKITDLKKYIDEAFRQIRPENIDIPLNRILCAAYIDSERTKGGIIRPSENVGEAIWQGKAALVIKCGPAVCVDTNDITFQGFTINPGDWVTFKVGNSSQIEINGYPCRIVSDHFIESKISDPRIITS